MAEDKIYLTVSDKKRQPENDGYVAVISRGQPQLGDESVTVLSMAIVKNIKAAREWYKEQTLLRPWVWRN